MGLVVILFGGNSCKKDDPCCTWSYAGDTYTYCRDGNEWKDYADTWDEFVTYAEAFGANCD